MGVAWRLATSLLLLLCSISIVVVVEPFSLLPTFNAIDTADGTDPVIALHPNSPPEADPHLLRVKRQAYQIHIDDQPSLTIESQHESGQWGEWTEKRACSRTCGGGVAMEQRECESGDQCKGAKVRYVSCNTDACPEEEEDFRAAQCASNNDKQLDGNYFKWRPHTGKNKCELACKPETANFYYKWADKVVDGTKCDSAGEEVCVDGVCLPVGCDGKLGSPAKHDKCGVCNGDGSKCKSVEGLFDDRSLPAGYHDVVTIPAGATSIGIEEVRPSGNSLAAKNASGEYFLNGNHKISVGDKDVEAAGTVFKYEKPKAGDAGATEKLTAKGPLKSDVVVALLLERGGKNVGVKYEYSIPVSEVPYIYKPGEWSGCSVTCGKGVKTRTPFCVDTESNQRASDELCEENNATKPEWEKPCETVDCEDEWYSGEWEDCSQTCGDHGWQYRVVYCHRIHSDGRRITVADENCTETERPPVKQTCNRHSCPEWHYGPWSACSEKCGDAKQYRSVTCRSEKEGEEGKLLAAEACGEQAEENGGGGVASERHCNLGPCEGLIFHTSDWDLCERCNETEETRNVTCRDTTGRHYPLEKCLNKTLTEIPADSRSCATPAPCDYEWHTSQWSKCSTECGHGHRTRKANCAIHEQDDILIVDEALCEGEKPVEREECEVSDAAQCKGTYFTGPWSECTESCEGGMQKRIVVCLDYDRQPKPEWCDESKKPEEERECNTEPCPKCEESEHGCCPDNVTFAGGPFNEGCSNCSITSEFGCCPDNVTDTTGPNGEGCPLLSADIAEGGEGEVEGSGEEPGEGEESTVPPTTPEEGDEEGTSAPAEDETCDVVNEETGEEISVPCSATIQPPSDEDEAFQVALELANGTVANITAKPAKKRCTKTEFGCCADWVTAAEGPNQEGCPQYVLGQCNGTKHGCCLDEVTLARGPNMAGCGDPSCAASLYGCCKDRKTIAFGPHYAGCERSSFPCEISAHGCCPDGETAALGPNGTGCGAGCLLTKWGCCPDGVTQAKGPNNENCGCKYAQYGCCPDGKSSAKGPSFTGCPDTCAQSQHGCCPDGKTPSRGPNKEGCPCQYTRWGCCTDGETTALGPHQDGCDDCRYAKYGCCPDGESKASGPAWAGCPATTPTPEIIGGTVSPHKIASCNLPQDQGQVCHPGYRLAWYYDSTEARCTQFWYGGCGGNANNFPSDKQCETVCVEPPELGRCYLPKMEGPQRCNQLTARYWYDYTTRQCAAFWWRGCLGNANNFGSWEECQQTCSSIGPLAADQHQQQPVTAPQPQQQPHYPPPGHVPAHSDHNVPQPERRPPPPPAPAPYPYPPADAEAPSSHSMHRMSVEECRQAVNSGDVQCRAYVDRWYFDAFSGRCAQFIYGGCGGNNNRFGSQLECEQRCGHHQPDYTARSRERQRQWPGVAEAGVTEAAPPPPQSQLPVAAQHMDREGEDHHSARVPLHHDPTTSQLISRHRHEHEAKSRDICNLQLDAGRCEGHFESFFYNIATGLCEPFQYTGCGGNANRFHTRDQCESLCLRGAPARLGSVASFAPQPNPDPAAALLAGQNNLVRPAPPVEYPTRPQQQEPTSECEHPKETGPCNEFKTKWFYNKADGTCNRFHWGGCGGNNNRFDTEHECRAKCGNHIPTCMLPKVGGPCAGKNERYYYDRATQQCTRFEYSGCLGNNNNFRSIQDCEAMCVRGGEAGRGGNGVDEGNKSKRATVIADGVKHHLQTLPVDNVSADVGAYSITHSLYSICSLPREIGPCRSFIPMFHYNTDSGVCEVFHYGGCLGNGNRFSTREACVQRCGLRKPPIHNRHSHPQGPTASRGVRKANERINDRHMEEGRGPWDPSTPTSGVPNLATMVDTLSAIKTGNSTLSHHRHQLEEAGAPGRETDNGDYTDEEMATMFPETRDSLPELCRLPEDRGPCYGEELRYRYDSESGECTSLLYTGCGGNANLFTSEEACLRACGMFRRQPVCRMEKEAGDCHMTVTKWYYDPALAECHIFQWGGCGGNGNRFSSKAECRNLCMREEESAPAGEMDSCRMERDAGPCNDPITQWYFDTAANECRKFTYGGCRGNGNRFNNKAECQRECQPPPASAYSKSAPRSGKLLSRDTCSLPFDSGPCEALEPSFYYSSVLNRCLPFTYGGCEGNGNRFARESDCMASCHVERDWTVATAGEHQTHQHLEHTGERKRARLVSSHAGGPVIAGSEIELKCLIDKEGAIEDNTEEEKGEATWYLNGVRLDHGMYGTHRFNFSRNRLLITNIGQQHRGEYSCVGGGHGSIVSQTMSIEVSELLLEAIGANCTDKGSPSTCELVNHTGLCSNVRYAKFCCRTCSQQVGRSQ